MPEELIQIGFGILWAIGSVVLLWAIYKLCRLMNEANQARAEFLSVLDEHIKQHSEHLKAHQDHLKQHQGEDENQNEQERNMH